MATSSIFVVAIIVLILGSVQSQQCESTGNSAVTKLNAAIKTTSMVTFDDIGLATPQGVFYAWSGSNGESLVISQGKQNITLLPIYGTYVNSVSKSNINWNGNALWNGSTSQYPGFYIWFAAPTVVEYFEIVFDPPISAFVARTMTSNLKGLQSWIKIYNAENNLLECNVNPQSSHSSVNSYIYAGFSSTVPIYRVRAYVQDEEIGMDNIQYITCDQGFQFNTTECVDINECLSGACGTQASCTNLNGSYECHCEQGFEFRNDTLTCQDIDECTTLSPCSSLANCTNTDGSFMCTCNEGYEGNGQGPDGCQAIQATPSTTTSPPISGNNSTSVTQPDGGPISVETPVRSDINETSSQSGVVEPPHVNVAEIVAPSVIVPVVVGVGVFVLIFMLRKKKRNSKSISGSNNVQMRPGAVLEARGLGDIESGIYDALPEKPSVPITDLQLIPRSAIELVKEIGAGSFGKVYKAHYKTSDVAVKLSNVGTSAQDFIKEASFQMTIPPHPNIVQLLGISLDGVNVLVVLEFCSGGSLDKIVFDNDEPIPEFKLIEMAHQIAQGLKHLHDNNIVHRDLACRNILISANNDLKISDFGMSRKLQEQENVGKTATNVGPIRWMAPESIGTRTYSKKSDIWTFGIILYEIVAREEPHCNKDIFEVAVLIRDQGFTPGIPSNCPAPLARIMQMCWKTYPNERPDIEQICDMLKTYDP